MARIAENEIKFNFRELRKLNKEYLLNPFIDITKDILSSGYSDKSSKEYDETIEFFCEKEILFFDPIKNIATVNSKIYLKAFSRL